MYNIVCLATASTEVEEFVQNPGVVKTYLDKYTPAVIGFLVQIIVAIIVLLVGCAKKKPKRFLGFITKTV